MTQFTDARPASAPTAPAARGLIRWVCTSNPFYVLSAGLFLAGLWASVESQPGDVQTVVLMSGLVGYTLLLAVTACLLVPLGGVWDDVRTVLLLVVLMFLATSVTFDESLVENPERGRICYLVGLFVAIAVSEGILAVTRLRLPGAFRVSYHLFLALFFLYPLAVRPWVDDPHSEELLWALFGFSPAAGLIALTLLPAIRRGSDYVANNGSPWKWPLYPWVLFGVLGFAVSGRAYLLCLSMHQLAGRDLEHLIFGFYFLVPFGFAVAVLLLELALVTNRANVYGAAFAMPLLLVFLAAYGHQDDSVYRGFLKIFTARLGGDPLTLTLLAAAGFYAYSALRGISEATEAATAMLLALAFVGPDTLYLWEPDLPRPLPFLAVAVLQLGLGLRRRNAWRCLIGSGCLVAGVAIGLPEGVPFRGVIAFHLVLLVVLLIGAAFNDALGRFLRVVGGGLVLLACLATAVLDFDLPESVPWLVEVYPLAWVVVLAGYGLLLRHRPSLVIAGLTLVGWLSAVGLKGYGALRQVVPGLDHIALSLILFGIAVLISLGKAGVLSGWLLPLRERLAKLQGQKPLGGLEPAPVAGIGLEPPAEAPSGEEIRREP